MKTFEIMLRALRSYTNFCGVILFCALTAMASQAQTLTTLADFNGTNGAGALGLIQGFDGNFYGTTLDGGTQNVGTVFKMTPAGVLTTIHSFCSEANCLDGSYSEGRLTQASNGNFYGPADFGGTNGGGVIYRITSTGKFTVLYNFGSQPNDADGLTPVSVVQARNGNLYGTTYGNRNNSPDLGTVFELTLGGTLNTLHTFSGPDGANPIGGMLQASNGNLYGTTSQGGSTTTCGPVNLPGCGTIFVITPSGTLTTLHIFDGSDGALPGYEGSLIEGTDRNLYGTAMYGGSSGPTPQCPWGCGTIFKISPAGKFTTLYNFCSQPNCSDGSTPVESLVQGTDGNIYGTTMQGGNSNNSGTIFKITPEGVLTTLYDFCSQPSCADGADPEAALIQDTDGNFYGTTADTVFRLSMGLGPFVKLVQDAGKVGQTIGIYGQGLTGTTGVFLNGTPASFKVLSDTVIRAIVPPAATNGFVTVEAPNGPLKSSGPFRVIP